MPLPKRMTWHEVISSLEELPHGVLKEAIQASVHVTGDYKLIISEQRFREHLASGLLLSFRRVLNEDERNQDL